MVLYGLYAKSVSVSPVEEGTSKKREEKTKVRQTVRHSTIWRSSESI